MTEQMVVVAALVCDEEGKILVSRRKEESFQGGRWEFPGGRVEIMEKPEDALKREMKEELDVKVDVGNIFSIDSHTYTIYDGSLRHVILLTYECRIKAGELKALGCSEFRWAYPDGLNVLDFVDADRRLVKKLVQ